MDGDSNAFVASAPGKVILFGEHAVVYGKTAIASALDLRVYSLFERTSDESITLDFPHFDFKGSWKLSQLESFFNHPSLADVNVLDPLTAPSDFSSVIADFYSGLEDNGAKAVEIFFFLFFALSKGSPSSVSRSWKVHVKSLLPVGMGLGSSGAFSVSIALGLLAALQIDVEGQSWDISNTKSLTTSQRHLLNSWAFQAERLAHGTPSGIDNSVSTFGTHCLQFDIIPELEWFLVNTKVPRKTSEWVGKVREYHKANPTRAAEIDSAIENVTQRALDGFVSLSLEELAPLLETLIATNQQLLRELGVSHTALEQVCATTAALGLQSKLTGAGGGGCAVTFVPPARNSPGEVVSRTAAVEKALGCLGVDVFHVRVGGPGAILQRLSDVPAELF